RGRAVGLHPVADLAVVIGSPALDRACARERAALGAAGGDGGDAACKPGDVDRGQPGGRRAVAELAVAVGAPALHSASARQRAGVQGAGGDGGDTACEPNDVYRGRAAGLRPIAELAIAVVAPALDSACARERTAVRVPCGDG